MPGFLLGVIYVNFIARRYVADPGIFSDYFLNQFWMYRLMCGNISGICCGSALFRFLC